MAVMLGPRVDPIYPKFPGKKAFLGACIERISSMGTISMHMLS